ncbi:MAG: hypothetical protein R2684_10505 [Pyrinomonadaceae bacterium]
MSKSKIKVIKKSEVVEKKPVARTKKKKQEMAKEIVTNVSSWVNEFQKRKRDETKRGFEELFAGGPQNASS